MARLKKNMLYLTLFVGFFIYTTIMSNWIVKDLNQKITDIQVLDKSPIITVDNCEAGKYSGKINGTVRNNTGKHIEKALLKIDLYDSDNRYIGTKYDELKYFNVNELLKFDTTFKFEDVKAVKLSVVYDEISVQKVSNKNSENYFDSIMTKENIEIAIPIVAGLTLFVIF